MTSQQVSLPWQQDISAAEPLLIGELTVVAGPNGGTVSGRITIDGKLARIASATGQGQRPSVDLRPLWTRISA